MKGKNINTNEECRVTWTRRRKAKHCIRNFFNRGTLWAWTVCGTEQSPKDVVKLQRRTA